VSDSIQVGDVVRLKSGSPNMTVTSVGEDLGGTMTVWCAWFDQKAAQQSGAFPLLAVEKAERDSKWTFA
jgi:uncharacterized protein YodC (DUF2158 family)